MLVVMQAGCSNDRDSVFDCSLVMPTSSRRMDGSNERGGRMDGSNEGGRMDGSNEGGGRMD